MENNKNREHTQNLLEKNESSEKKVYVLYTNTMYMKRIKKAIERYVLKDNESIYSPMIEKTKRFKGKDRKVLTFMFSGYLFIETCDAMGLYHRLKDAIGQVIFRYCKILKKNERIYPLKKEEYQKIIALCNEKHILESSKGYMVGDELIITDGPLQNFKGKILKINRHKKLATISCLFLGEIREITVGLEIVKKYSIL